MKNLKRVIEKNTLFAKIVLIVTAGILLVSGCLSIFIMKVSEDNYINTYSNSIDILLKQINNDYYNLHEDVINVLGTCNNSNVCKNFLTQTDMDSRQESVTVYQLVNLFKDTKILTNNISSNLILIGDNGKTFINNDSLKNMSANEIMQSDVVKTAIQHPDIVTYQLSKDKFTSTVTNEHAVVAIKALRLSTKDQPYGISMVILNQEEFMSFYDNLIDSHVNQVVIINREGEIISSNDSTLIGSRDEELLQRARSQIDDQKGIQQYHSKEKGKMTSIARYMPFYDSYLVSTIDNSVFVSSVSNVPIVIGVCCLTISIMLIIVFFSIRKTMRPIKALSERMPEITNGNFNNHIEVIGNGEVKDLSIAFNFMLDGLNEYVEKLMKLSEEKRLSEIHALQMQINPHFIYNTLTSIKFMAWQGNKDKQIQTIDAFIQLLRNTLSNSDEVVAVEREIDNIKNYVQIQTTRYGDQIQVHYFIQEECYEYEILKMILQPFIENAFFHAFTGMDKGTIDVFGKIKEDHLIFEIIDNGVGMEQTQIKDMLKSSKDKGRHFTGIGIQNVNDRIKLLYGEGYGVVISSNVGQGTIVTITLPLIKGEYRLEKEKS